MEQKLNNIICLDTETTGLDYDDEILQLSIANINGDILFNELIKPKAHTTWLEAQEIHGIDPEMVKDKKYLLDYKNEIENIINNADLIIGYNLDFDLSMLKTNDIDITNIKKTYDVMLTFAEIYGEWSEWHCCYKWQKLSTCASYYGYEFKAHDSLEDVKATIYCYKKMTENNKK